MTSDGLHNDNDHIENSPVCDHTLYNKICDVYILTYNSIARVPSVQFYVIILCSTRGSFISFILLILSLIIKIFIIIIIIIAEGKTTKGEHIIIIIIIVVYATTTADRVIVVKNLTLTSPSLFQRSVSQSAIYIYTVTIRPVQYMRTT